MSRLLVPFGYGAQRLTLDQLDEHETWSRLHPEFKRRVRALFEAADGHLGCGTGWRSSDVQRALFLQRHVVSSTGTINWDGKRWALKPGMAAAAPPGSSFHEGVDDGAALAIDLVGDTKWAGAHAAQFGLIEFSQVNHEPWHFQCAELPRSVKRWITAGRPQPTGHDIADRTAKSPAAAAPRAEHGACHPVLHLGDHGPEVATMQALLVHAGRLTNSPGNRDGCLGPATVAVLKQFQRDHGLSPDGICGPRTWTALAS